MENSNKSIIEKLKLDKYADKLVLNIPKSVSELNELNFDTTIQKPKYDLIFTFVFNLEMFRETLFEIIQKDLLNKNGYVFLAYPKKNNPVYQEYIERDSIFPAIQPDEEGYVKDSSLKFSRMVSLNEIFTVVGLKSSPKRKNKNTNSQYVDDYIVNIDDIKQYLSKDEDLLNFYNQLTFGYQKDWARYIFSAKRTETREKRFLEMETVLGEGYKSIDLYKRGQR